jgi:hypothetical protein
MPDSDKPHRLTYVDVISKLTVSAAAAVAACLGVLWSRDSSDRNRDLLEKQTKNQVRSVDLQDRLYQAQVAGNMMPYLNCKSPLSSMGLQVTHNAAPMYEVDAVDALAPCAKTPEEQMRCARLRQAAQGREIKLAFLRHLQNAEDYFHVGLDEAAANEYQLAYEGLPAEYDRLVNHDAAKRAKQSLSDEQFHAAAQFFISAFDKIPNDIELGRK